MSEQELRDKLAWVAAILDRAIKVGDEYRLTIGEMETLKRAAQVPE